MRSSSKTYSVMSGEPQLGKQIETTYTFDKEEIVEKLVELWESDAVESPKSKVLFGEGEYVDIGTWMSQTDINQLNTNMNQRFLDDDYGTQKVSDFLADWFDNLIADNETVEFEGVEYV